MKTKKYYLLFIFSMMFTFALFSNFSSVKAADDFDYKGIKVNIETNKSWVVKFNKELDKDTVNSKNIYVTDENWKTISSTVSLKNDYKSVVIESKNNYDYGKTYNLIVKDGLKAKDGKNLGKSARFQFTIKNTVQNAGNYTVCIDASRGGNDVGNISQSGLKEKDVNLAVALKVGKLLEDNGVKVVYTRNSDNINWSNSDDLKKRFEICNNAKADYFVDIRCNTFTNTSISGIETYYSEWNPVSKSLAENVQKELVASTGSSDRGVKVGQPSHEILRGTSGNSIMVELGFMSNSAEAAIMGKEDFQNKSAAGISNGILKSLSLADKDKNKTISSVKEISASVSQGEDFQLPLSIQAAMSDGSSKYVGVIWNAKEANTSSTGTYKYKGYVGGYGKEVTLALTINDKNSKPNPNPSGNGEEDVICIDPGHGRGRDTGATGINGLQEDDVTLAVGLRVGEILRNRGIKVIYTRTEDERSVSMSVTDSLQKRCDVANDAKAKYFVSIHCNSFDAESANGTETLYYTGNETGERLAKSIQQSIVNTVGTYNRGLKDGAWLYVTQHTNCPAVLTELGFLTNPSDAAKLSSDEYRQKYAEAIADGITKFLGK